MRRKLDRCCDKGICDVALDLRLNLEDVSNGVRKYAKKCTHKNLHVAVVLSDRSRIGSRLINEKRCNGRELNKSSIGKEA